MRCLERWIAWRSSRARSWTAKEAAFKALHGQTARPIRSWHDLVVGKPVGSPKPAIALSPAVHADASLFRLHLSASHEGDTMVAFVVAERAEDFESTAAAQRPVH